MLFWGKGKRKPLTSWFTQAGGDSLPAMLESPYKALNRDNHLTGISTVEEKMSLNENLHLSGPANQITGQALIPRYSICIYSKNSRVMYFISTMDGR